MVVIRSACPARKKKKNRNGFPLNFWLFTTVPVVSTPFPFPFVGKHFIPYLYSKAVMAQGANRVGSREELKHELETSIECLHEVSA